METQLKSKVPFCVFLFCSVNTNLVYCVLFLLSRYVKQYECSLPSAPDDDADDMDLTKFNYLHTPNDMQP